MSPNNHLFRSTPVDSTTPQETFRYLNKYGNPMEAFYFILILSKPKHANIKATLFQHPCEFHSQTPSTTLPQNSHAIGFYRSNPACHIETAPHIRPDSLTKDMQSTENLVTIKYWCSEPKLLLNRHRICSHPDRSMNVLGG